MDSNSNTKDIVRLAVRSVIERTPELKHRPALRKKIAERMVGVSLAAAELIAEEQQISHEIENRVQQKKAMPLASAMAAGDQHRRTAVSSAADVLKRTRDAIDFPNFVTSLITGVFQSIQTSNIQQLQAVSDLLEAVSGSASEFSTQHISDDKAASWVVSRFNNFEIKKEGDEFILALRDGADLPEAAELKSSLGASSTEVSLITEDELKTSLLPLVKRKLARERQSLLSTMILMGLQRVVVDDGSLHASMRLQVDARSVAEQTTKEQFDSRVETSGGASFGVGNWGASAKMSASVGYVHSDEQFSKEDIAVSAGLRSSVDLRFRTLPLDVSRMGSQRTLNQIQGKSLVPERETELGSLIKQDVTRKTTSPPLAKPPTQKQVKGAADEEAKKAEAARKKAQQKEKEKEQQNKNKPPSKTGKEQNSQKGKKEAAKPPPDASKKPGTADAKTTKPPAKAKALSGYESNYSNMQNFGGEQAQY